MTKTRKRKLPKARTITVPDQSYHPPKAKREKEARLILATVTTVNLGDRRDAFEKLRDTAAEAYRVHTGDVWRPCHGSLASQTGRLTSAAIDARFARHSRVSGSVSRHHRRQRRSVTVGIPHLRPIVSRRAPPPSTSALTIRNSGATRKRRPKKRADGGVTRRRQSALNPSRLRRRGRGGICLRIGCASTGLSDRGRSPRRACRAGQS